MHKSFYLAAASMLALVPAFAQAEDYKVVVLQSQTGGAAFIGMAVTNGARLAANQLNAEGFMGEGNTLAVEYVDDATDRTQTMSLFARYASDPSVLAILGPTSGAVALAGASSANDFQISSITTTNTVEVLDQGPWSFILTQPSFITIPYLTEYARAVGIDDCTVIGIRDIEAYVALQKEFENQFAAAGGTINGIEQVAGTDSDFAALATKVASQTQECVFISAPASQGANIIMQLKQAGLDPATQILGHNAFASPEFVERGGAAVEGAIFIGDWVPGGYDDFSRAFDAAFTEAYGTPPDNWSAVGYGGMRVLANAIKNAGPDATRDGVREQLGLTKDVQVAAGEGIYGVDENRVPRVGMNVLQVQDGTFVRAPR